jgi:NAD(P)-dependent dehydrogenase (short-subunit alcohol dehydrogenase family)
MEKRFKIDLSKKNILVTGAAGLLGSEFVNFLVEFNARCVCIDKNLDLLKKKFKKKSNERILYYKCDITKTNDLKKINNILKKKKIFIDTIINNAAINPTPGSKNKGWNTEIEVGLTGANNVISEFTKTMIKKKDGNVINIGSDLSVIAPNQEIYERAKLNYIKPLSYSVIKHGIVGMTKYYASLLGKYNIRCNCISPGGVNNNLNKKLVKELTKHIPLKRMAAKDEYNHAILFLCSDGLKYMTGQNMVIDGGRSII